MFVEGVKGIVCVGCVDLKFVVGVYVDIFFWVVDIMVIVVL